MSYYENLSAQLQSRIKRRGNHIAAAECWKKGYHALGQLKKFRETKAELAGLRGEQVLDKNLLKVMHDIATQERVNAEWMEKLMSEFPA